MSRFWLVFVALSVPRASSPCPESRNRSPAAVSHALMERTSIVVALAVWLVPAAGYARTTVHRGEAAPVIQLGDVTNGAIDHAKLGLSTLPERTRAELTLTLSTTSTEPRDVSTTFEVPHGARVLAMSFRRGDGQFIAARSMADPVAERVFERVVHRRKDPAMLRFAQQVGTRDRYSLHVYPLSLGATASVLVEIELPGTRAVELASTTAVETEIVDEGEAPLTANVDPPEPVSERIALFADEVDVLPTGTRRVDLELAGPDETPELRSAVGRKLSRVSQCFANEKALVGGITLRFAVVPGGSRGRVAAVSVDGASTAVSDCVAQEVGQWKFDKVDDATLVAYPVVWQRT